MVYPGKVSNAAHLNPAVVRDWLALTVAGLQQVKAEINDLNVFPIPDSDTGSNLLFTIAAAAEAVNTQPLDAGIIELTRAMSDGAVAAARGNSGIILAQVLVGFADAAQVGISDDGILTFHQFIIPGLKLASLAARRAVSEPREGTVLTLLSNAANLASNSGELSPPDLARTLADHCADDLAHTTEQLACLAEAGVVDAGGRGLLVLFDAMVQTLTGVSAARQHYKGAFADGGETKGHSDDPCAGADDTDFEIMYLIDTIKASDIAELRNQLNALGNAVVIIGDSTEAGERFSVHVHSNNPGGVIEAGISLGGNLSQIRISCFLLDAVNAHSGVTRVPPVRKRALIAVVTGEAIAQLCTAEGAYVVRADGLSDAETSAALIEAIITVDSAHTVLMACGMLTAQELVTVAAAARTAERTVVMLPATSMVQALAALAVHDFSRHADDDAYAMAEAVSATRSGEIVTAATTMMTVAGLVHPGEFMAYINEDVRVVQADLAEAACALADLLLSSGGELVTALTGLELPEQVVSTLERHLRTSHPGVEFISHEGGQTNSLIQIGIE